MSALKYRFEEGILIGDEDQHDPPHDTILIAPPYVYIVDGSNITKALLEKADLKPGDAVVGFEPGRRLPKFEKKHLTHIPPYLAGLAEVLEGADTMILDLPVVYILRGAHVTHLIVPDDGTGLRSGLRVVRPG